MLRILSVVTALFTIASPVYALSHECPITLLKGQEEWKIDLFALGWFDFLAVFTVVMLPKFAWLASLFNILMLARRYEHGRIFDQANARRFVRIGECLVLVGLLDCMIAPFINYFLYWRGISPWVGDMPLAYVVQPNYVAAGVFFVVMGKVTQRAFELQEDNRLIV